jgi:hypothetical protein
MAENFELLGTEQIGMMHDQLHERINAGGEEDCDMLRMQHDSLAAEMIKRGIPHDTEVMCSESELAQKAPGYRRGFTDDICTQCAFGQLYPFCNLYKADYTKGYTCDSFNYFEVLELEPPHGFLMAQEKQTAIATNKPLNEKSSHIIVSNDQVFGIAVLDEPAQMKTKEFDSEVWLNQHRITPRERRQWWSDTELFYVYRVKEWYPYEGVKLYENGQVIDEPKLTARQWQIISTAKELPKQITLLEDAVSVSDKQEFIIDLSVKCKELDSILSATYQTDVKEAETANELISLYSLALVRNPRMRVSKKNIEKAEKQEGDDMPFAIREREDEYCVVKINPDDTEETMACHDTEAEAEAQLAALRINVEAEEAESAVHTDKPKKRKPRKKEIIVANFSNEGVTYETAPGLDEIITTGSGEKVKKAGFIDRLKSATKTLLDIITLAETEEKEAKVELLTSNYGIAQKEVNGELWHFTWSTNAFEDREKEIFSTNSLKRYVDQASEKEERGYFNLWHMQGTDFARKEWQMVIGRFLVEAGPYTDDKAGLAAKEFFKKYGNGHPEIAPEGWGCSPEFRYLPEERATGTYENIWITRTSTLPRMAAANIWTETSQLARSKMALTDYSEDQIKTAIEVFQDEDFVQNLIAVGETKTAELEAAGIAHKDNDKPQEIQLNMEELAAEVGKQFQVNLDPIAEAMATMATELKELKEWREKQEKKEDVKNNAETPRFIFNMQRASETAETIVAEGDGLKNQKPREAQVGTGDAWSQIFNK